jgi:nitroreductase
VRDPGQRQKLRAAAWGQAQVTDASLLLVLAGDTQAHARDPKRYWRNAPEPTRDMLAGMITKYYSESEQLQRDEVMRSVGIAAQTIMLAARGMGYDSCPMVGYDPVKVAEIINLPTDYVLGMMIAVGRKVQDARPRGGQLDHDEVVSLDTF